MMKTIKSTRKLIVRKEIFVKNNLTKVIWLTWSKNLADNAGYQANIDLFKFSNFLFNLFL